MEHGMPLSIGVAPQNTDNPYTGRHRVFGNSSHGIGFIPLGDRNRDKPEVGIEYIVERNSIDKYTKYHGN